MGLILTAVSSKDFYQAWKDAILLAPLVSYAATEAAAMKLASTLLLLFLAVLGNQAQTVQSVFDYKPFNISREDLPPHYAGNPLIEIYSALKTRPDFKKKDEFESTVDYKARLQKAAERPIVGTISGNSTMAFSLSNPILLDSKYDADLSVMDISFMWLQMYEVSINRLSVRYSEDSKFRGSYVGQNAFKHKVTVSIYDDREFWIASAWAELAKLQAINSQYQREAQFTASIPLPPQDARSAKQNLRALLIGKLADEPIDTRSSYHSPTISEPAQRSTTYAVINLVPIAIWFYDGATGRILAKIDLK